MFFKVAFFKITGGGENANAVLVTKRRHINTEVIFSRMPFMMVPRINQPQMNINEMRIIYISV